MLFIYNLLLSAEKIAHVGKRVSAPPSAPEDHRGAVLRYRTVGHIDLYSVWRTEDNVMISEGFFSVPLIVLKIIRLFQIVFVLHCSWVVKTLGLEKAALATRVPVRGNSCSPWTSHRIPSFGRADVIWKLHSRVNAASCSPPLLAESSLVSDGHTSGRNQTSPERQINPVKPPTSEPETKRPDLARAEHQDAEPRFLWAKASWTFFRGGGDCTKTATTKMNRSFHKSQPLRSADCNAVEVKSKVSVKVSSWKFWLLTGTKTPPMKSFTCWSGSWAGTTTDDTLFSSFQPQNPNFSCQTRQFACV